MGVGLKFFSACGHQSLYLKRPHFNSDLGASLHPKLLWEERVTGWVGTYEVQSMMDRGPGRGPQPEQIRLPQRMHPIMQPTSACFEGRGIKCSLSQGCRSQVWVQNRSEFSCPRVFFSTVLMKTLSVWPSLMQYSKCPPILRASCCSLFNLAVWWNILDSLDF